MNNLLNQLKKTKHASYSLAGLNTSLRNKILSDIVESLQKNTQAILAANLQDLKNFKGDDSVKQRLKLDQKKLVEIVSSIHNVADLKDPLNKTLEQIKRPNGLRIKKLSVPLGVVGVIYESRP